MIDILTTQIKGSLENKIFDNLVSQNTGISSPILRAVVSRVAEEVASATVQQVNLGANQQVDSIPKNLLGIKNPVNIVSDNLSSLNLTNNLNNILTTQFSSQLTDLLATRLESELRRALPANQRNLINFSNISATLVQSITPTINNGITASLSSFASGIFNRGQTTPSLIENVSSLFATRDSESAIQEINKQNASIQTNNALRESRNFNVTNETNQEKIEVVNKGFADPQANYPTKEYAGIAETNKLAQGDIRGTIVQSKNKSRMTGAKLPGGDAWDQPESPFKGEYPYNKVTQTEQGHIIEVDDTPGAERLHIFHRSGTFIEIDANGSVVKRAVGSSYEIIDRNGKIAIAGKADISINGACNIFIGNDANIEVEGDVNLTCHNDITAMAAGTLNLSGREEVNITGGNVSIEAYTAFNAKSGNVLNIHSGTNLNIHSNAEIVLQAIELYSNVNSQYQQTTSDYHVKIGGTGYLSSESDINLDAGGDLNFDSGGDLHLNSGTSTTANESKPGTIATNSNIGVMSGRKDIFDNSKIDPSFLTLADTKSIELEEETQTNTDFNTHKDLIITSGFATASEIEAAPITIERESVTSTQNTAIAADEKLLTYTTLPGNFNLSPNFTVEMLSSKAAVTKDIIQATDKLTYGEIVFNLSSVALNVLEPIYKIYPNMFVTSAYRNPNNKSNAATSQHPLGQAVDIQFKGISKEQYYEIAKLLGPVINYDQLLLEFCNYTKNPWIHISYTAKNRKQVMTFFNHKKYSDGLSQLA